MRTVTIQTTIETFKVAQPSHIDDQAVSNFRAFYELAKPYIEKVHHPEALSVMSAITDDIKNRLNIKQSLM